MSPNILHLPIGTLLGGGKYRIVRFISAGGFGCTYEAEFVPMKSRVAIKEFFVNSFCNRDASGTISLGAASQAELVDRLEEKFVREAQRLFKLKHPGIVGVSDILHENGTSYYIMDYIEGRSLYQVVKQSGPLSEAQALRYLSQVMDALEYVHSKNMLHLDIKPGNIMIDNNDNAILIDFGESKQYDEVNGQNTSTIMGQTPGYAPPEQTGSCIRQFSPTADIYALGATFYTMLTGSVPPSSPDLISGEAQLEPLPSGVSHSSQNVIDWMMQPNIKKRPQSISDARAILFNKEADHDVSNVDFEEQPNNEDYELEDYDLDERKSKKWLWLGVCGIAVLAGIVIYVLTRGTAPEEEVDALTDSINIDAIELSDEAGQKPANSRVRRQPVVNEQQQTQVETRQLGGIVNGHDWLDMGTSVKWATCNVGAKSPMGLGSYFAWGEISPKSDYNKENSHTSGIYISSIKGNITYDVALASWGSPWRMPTKEEFQELLDKCKWEWRSTGVKVIAENGNVLLFPAAGWYYGESLFQEGVNGYYWTATPYGVEYAWYFFFSVEGQRLNDNRRFDGLSVRPVADI